MSWPYEVNLINQPYLHIIIKYVSHWIICWTLINDYLLWSTVWKACLCCTVEDWISHHLKKNKNKQLSQNTSAIYLLLSDWKISYNSAFSARSRRRPSSNWTTPPTCSSSSRTWHNQYHIIWRLYDITINLLTYLE